MANHEMIAMILAGGRGTRLYQLTEKDAKPAVSFGGRYRIIDFPLSNCANSNVDVVGVLTQYESIFLNSYVSLGSRWGLDARNSGVFVLPPRETHKGFGVYKGTADAISQNIDFIDSQNPDYVLVLSGDHIYKMDYSKMLENHKEQEADCSIAVLEVSLKEASRFGIMNVDKNDVIYEFEEKPAKPKSTLASMGIYIFNWKLLRKILIEDEKNEHSSHDFGHDIIPRLLNEKKKMVAYRFKGYWKDVGTVDSLWEANMDLLNPKSGLKIKDFNWKIYSQDTARPPHIISDSAVVKNSMIDQGSFIEGTVENSVIGHNVYVSKGAVVKNSVITSGVVIGPDTQVNRAIVMENLTLLDKKYGSDKSDSISLISQEQGEN